MSDKKLAELFHETYERLAPEYGYLTNASTKQFNEESSNGKLMIATCKEIRNSAWLDCISLAIQKTGRSYLPVTVVDMQATIQSLEQRVKVKDEEIERLIDLVNKAADKLYEGGHGIAGGRIREAVTTSSEQT